MLAEVRTLEMDRPTDKLIAVSAPRLPAGGVLPYTMGRIPIRSERRCNYL